MFYDLVTSLTRSYSLVVITILQAAVFCAAQIIPFANVSLAVSAESFLKDVSVITSQL